MSSRIWSATCAAIVLGVSVGMLAQEAPTQKPAASASSGAGKAITVSGCLGKAEQGATGTTGTAGATASAKEPKFVLSKAAMATSGTAGTAGTAPAAAIASEYKIDGDDAKLTPHVGHKVEITGTVEEAKGATQAPAASAANAPTLKVDNLKMVSPSCQ
jgi:hypothetical protein